MKFKALAMCMKYFRGQEVLVLFKVTVLVLLLGDLENPIQAEMVKYDNSLSGVQSNIVIHMGKVKQGGIEIRGFLELPDRKWPLLFEDGEHFSGLIDEIVKDLNLIHSRVIGYKVVKKPDGDTFKISGENIISEETLYFGMNPNLFRPDQVHSDFGSLVELESQKYIVVSRRLVNAYKAAMLLRDENKVAFRRLYDFVSFVNNLGPDYEFSYEEVIELYYFKHLSENRKNELLSSIPKKSNNLVANPFKDTTLDYPSILDFFIRKEHDDFEGMLVCMVSKSKKQTNRVVSEIPLVYADAKWQFIVLSGE